MSSRTQKDIRAIRIKMPRFYRTEAVHKIFHHINISPQFITQSEKNEGSMIAIFTHDIFAVFHQEVH